MRSGKADDVTNQGQSSQGSGSSGLYNTMLASITNAFYFLCLCIALWHASKYVYDIITRGLLLV